MKDEGYEKYICKNCENKDNCNKDKYKKKTILEKTTIYCLEYKFKNM